MNIPNHIVLNIIETYGTPEVKKRLQELEQTQRELRMMQQQKRKQENELMNLINRDDAKI
jgi:hypothetical protein